MSKKSTLCKIILIAGTLAPLSAQADLKIRSDRPPEEEPERMPFSKSHSTQKPWQTEKLQELATSYSTAVSILRSQSQKAESILKAEQNREIPNIFEIQRWSQVLYHLKEEQEELWMAYEEHIREVLDNKQIAELGKVNQAQYKD